MAVNMVFPSVPVVVAVPALMTAVPGSFLPCPFTLVGLATVSLGLGGQVTSVCFVSCMVSFTLVTGSGLLSALTRWSARRAARAAAAQAAAQAEVEAGAGAGAEAEAEAGHRHGQSQGAAALDVVMGEDGAEVCCYEPPLVDETGA